MTALRKVFTAAQFTPTEYDTAETKAKFANALLNFIDKGCPANLWTKVLYNRLSLCFGHIAHYNQYGFFDVWFSTPQARAEFIKHLLAYGCFGSPEYTYSDVERALQAKVLERGFLRTFAMQATQDTEQRERAILATLKAKYERSTQ